MPDVVEVTEPEMVLDALVGKEEWEENVPVKLLVGFPGIELEKVSPIDEEDGVFPDVGEFEGAADEALVVHCVSVQCRSSIVIGALSCVSCS